MTVGPLHLVVVSFDDDKVVSDIGVELGKVRKHGIIRLFDFLYILKHEDGSIAAKEISDLSADEKYQYGGLIKSLVGLVVDEGDAMLAGEVEDIPGMEGHDFGLNQDEVIYIADKIQPGRSALLLLFEHRWAVGLKEAMLNAGGTTLVQKLIDPEAFRIVGSEFQSVVEAANRLEEKTLAETMDLLVAATVAKREAEEEAEQVKMAAAAEVAEAEERAEKAAAEAQDVEQITAAEVVMLREAAEKDRLAAEEARKAAELVKAQAVEDAREVVVAAKAVEAVAMNEAAETMAEAREMEEGAMRRAAAVMDAADDAEANAMMRALQALVAADMIEQQAMEEAVQALIAADIVEQMAAERAGRALLSGSLH